MTREELKKYDGNDGRPAYVACNGKIYDVTASKLWKNGKHVGRFNAGEDHSATIGLSPHGEKNLFKFTVVGELTESTETAEVDSKANSKTEKMLKYQELYAKLHPHPMMVHFPMGMFPLAFFLEILAILTGGNFYLTFASIAAFVFGTIFTIPAVLTGFISFAVNYGWKSNVYLKRKIILSALLFVIGIYGSFIGLKATYYAICPAAAGAPYEPLGLSYTIATIIVMVLIPAIGYNGGKITWPN